MPCWPRSLRPHIEFRLNPAPRVTDQRHPAAISFSAPCRAGNLRPETRNGNLECDLRVIRARISAQYGRPLQRLCSLPQCRPKPHSFRRSHLSQSPGVDKAGFGRCVGQCHCKFEYRLPGCPPESDSLGRSRCRSPRSWTGLLVPAHHCAGRSNSGRATSASSLTLRSQES
jgi:hypothetical protein